jgi:hypothetical protein
VLAVAIDADHVVVTEFEGEAVAGLDASAESEVVGQSEDAGSGFAGSGDSVVGGVVVDYEDGGVGHGGPDFADDSGDGAFFVEGGDED